MVSSSSYCGVFGCQNNAKTMPHLSFFGLPKDDERRKKWIELMDRNDIMKINNPRQLVCSVHFTKDMFKNKRLKPYAVPSLNLPGSKVLSSGSSSKENVETQVDNLVIVEMVQGAAERNTSKISNDAVEHNSSKKPDINDTMDHEDNHEEHLDDPESKCSNCKADIIGFRYTCVVCADWDLCGACEARQAHAHHYVLRIPLHRTQQEVCEVIRVVRSVVARQCAGGGAGAAGGAGLGQRASDPPEADEPEISILVIKEEASDPLQEDPNVHPHELNMLEQPLLDIPLLKEEPVDHEQFLSEEEPERTTTLAEIMAPAHIKTEVTAHIKIESDTSSLPGVSEPQSSSSHLRALLTSKPSPARGLFLVVHQDSTEQKVLPDLKPAPSCSSPLSSANEHTRQSIPALQRKRAISDTETPTHVRKKINTQCKQSQRISSAGSEPATRDS